MNIETRIWYNANLWWSKAKQDLRLLNIPIETPVDSFARAALQTAQQLPDSEPPQQLRIDDEPFVQRHKYEGQELAALGYFNKTFFEYHLGFAIPARWFDRIDVAMLYTPHRPLYRDYRQHLHIFNHPGAHITDMKRAFESAKTTEECKLITSITGFLIGMDDPEIFRVEDWYADQFNKTILFRDGDLVYRASNTARLTWMVTNTDETLPVVEVAKEEGAARWLHKLQQLSHIATYNSGSPRRMRNLQLVPQLG